VFNSLPYVLSYRPSSFQRYSVEKIKVNRVLVIYRRYNFVLGLHGGTCQELGACVEAFRES
jgi:hypothetical protein